MPIPDFQTLMLPVLRRLAQQGSRIADLFKALSDEFALDEEERAVKLPSGHQGVMANRLNWALTYLFKAGLIARVGRGDYKITDAGTSLLLAPPERLTLPFLAQKYPPVAAFRSGGPQSASEIPLGPGVDVPDAVTEATPEASIGQAMATIEAKLRSDLLMRLLEMSPSLFERSVVDLLLAMGYGNKLEDAGKAIGKSGDGGVDGVIREDKLGLDLIYIQAKRYKDASVTSEHVRSFAGALEDKGARKGVFITTSSFTAGARAFAVRQQTKRIVLIDGEMLTGLMLANDVGVKIDRTIFLKQIDNDYFEPIQG